MEEVNIEDIIIKYARYRRLSKREKAALDKFRSQSKYHYELPDLFRNKEWLEENLSRLKTAPSDLMWTAIRESQTYDANTDTSQIPALLPPPRPVWMTRSRISAAIVHLIFILGLFYCYKNRNSLNLFSAANHQSAIAKAGALGDHEYVSTGTQPNGMHLQLSDGTSVTLAFGSSIQTDFEEGRRKVEVKGRAQFIVAKDPDRPFMLNMDKTTVKVLGTTFDVFNYPDEPKKLITLQEGKVLVLADNSSATLDKPGARAVVSGGKITLQQAPKSWVDPSKGFLDFEGEDLTVVLKELSACYQVNVIRPKNMDSFRPVTAKFYLDRSLATNLDLLNKFERMYFHFEAANQSILVTNWNSR